MHARALVLLMCAGQIGSLLPHVVVPAVMTAHLIVPWGLTQAQAGLMAAAYAGGYLLGVVPLRLQAHFERLQRDAGDDPGWPRVFAADRDRVLTAELAHRLLPARGLLDTLHTAHPT